MLIMQSACRMENVNASMDMLGVGIIYANRWTSALQILARFMLIVNRTDSALCVRASDHMSVGLFFVLAMIEINKN